LLCLLDQVHIYGGPVLEVERRISIISTTKKGSTKEADRVAKYSKYGKNYEDILSMEEGAYPEFTLAKNKARFLRMVNWYKQKQEWLDVAPFSALTKLFKTQTKELETIRACKMDYEMELEMDTLTPSQRSYRKDELKMYEMHERMAVSLISKMQMKLKSGRR
jgi:hypothetical protein